MNIKEIVFRSIKTKILISVIGTIVFFGVLATATVYFLTKNNLINLVNREYKEMAVSQADSVYQVLYESENIAKKISGQPEIHRLLGEAYDYEVNKADKTFLEKFNIAERYSAIYVMDAEGNTMISTDERFVGNNYSFRDYFKTAISKGSAIDISVGVTSGELGYYFSNSINNSSSGVLGVVVLKLEPEYVESQIRKNDNSDEIMIVDNYGVVIQSTDEAKLYHSLGELASIIKEKVADKKRYGETQIEKLDYQVVMDEIGTSNDTQIFSHYDNADEKNELLILSPIGDTEYYVLLGVGYEVVEKLSFYTSFVIAGFVFAAALFALVIIVIQITKFLRPIKTLESLAKELEDGKLDNRADVFTGDEFQTLAKSLNKMAHNLEESRKGTEQKIKERTEELEKINEYLVDREIRMSQLKDKIKKYEDKI